MHSTSPELPAPATTIIRTGSDGRLRFTPEQRAELLDAFARSGLSAMAFARGHGVNYQTFIAWLRKRREAELAPPAGAAFAELLLDESGPAAAGLRVTLPCGAAIELASRAALPLVVELLSLLRRPC